VDLVLSAEQRSIVESVADVLVDTMPVDRVRQVLEGDPESLDELWSKAAELGWFGLGLTESLGGTGFELVEEALLFKELGRHLTPGPFLATVLAARVAAVAGADDAGAKLLAAKLLVGEARAGLAVPLAGDRVRLIDAVGAECLLVVLDKVAALFPESALTERTAVRGLDELTAREQAVLSGEPTAVVAVADDPVAARGSVLLSAMLTGIAEATRDMSVRHAKTREQFGSPIGAFQAVKHRCADMAVAAALADAQLTVAALSVTEGADDAGFQVAAARSVAERAALGNARETIQIHGGIGVTWECDAQLYLKRAHALREAFDGESQQRDRLL
jgi:alkylation response protein AidB-like acyl-CoA dehydrogenase